MPSPFPGMDPYLEDPALWSGFHTRLIVAIGESVEASLPDGYYSEVEQHVWLEDADSETRTAFIPDAFIAPVPGDVAVAEAPLRVTTATSQVRLEKPVKRKGHRYLKIVDRRNNRIVTAVEVLSPSNKDSGEDRDSYLAKRDEYISANVNLLEIDLLRSGERIPMGRPRPPIADYYAMVSQANEFPRASIWAFTVRDMLPVLPVPLKPSDGSVELSLGDCFNRVYKGARYDRRIDYSSPPFVKLNQADIEWMQAFLPKTRKSKTR
jgi:hypothetical protein